MIYRIEELCKSFKSFAALKKVSFEVEEPGIYGILGPNGAGKTTFLKLILKILSPTSGAIYLEGKNIETMGSEYYRSIGAVLEGNRNLYWYLTARQNLMYSGTLMNLSSKEISERTEYFAREMDLLEHMDKKVGYMSRGMQQKVAIMAALIHRPKILLLDEPTLGLDVVTKQNLIPEIKKMADDGTTVFLTTHQIDVLERLTDRLTIFQQGRLTYQGSTEELVRKACRSSQFEFVLKTSDEALAFARIEADKLSDLEHNQDQIKFTLPIGEAEVMPFIEKLSDHHIRLISFAELRPELEQVLVDFFEGES